MANIEKVIPHILKWECGISAKLGETAVQLFERSRSKGYVNDPLDRGGATQSGLTIGAYKEYCLKRRLPTPTVTDLKNIKYATWLAILKENYWDRYKADQILNQSVANICVDYVWGSGKYGITKVQKALGLVNDGIVGAKTIAAINAKPALTMFNLVKNVRIAHYNAIVKASPSQARFLKGWISRVNDLKFSV